MTSLQERINSLTVLATIDKFVVNQTGFFADLNLSMNYSIPLLKDEAYHQTYNKIPSLSVGLIASLEPIVC